MTLSLPCPTCHGDGFASTEDRHTETRMDVCPMCRGYGTIPARTGETAEASAQRATPDQAALPSREART